MKPGLPLMVGAWCSVGEPAACLLLDVEAVEEEGDEEEDGVGFAAGPRVLAGALMRPSMMSTFFFGGPSGGTRK